MKEVISKIFNWIKSLFLRLRVLVTLELGKDKEESNDDTKEDSQDD